MELSEVTGGTTFRTKLKLDGLTVLRVEIPANLPRQPLARALPQGVGCSVLPSCRIHPSTKLRGGAERTGSYHSRQSLKTHSRSGMAMLCQSL